MLLLAVLKWRMLFVFYKSYKSVLSEIFRSKEDDRKAEWRGLHNKDVSDLYSPNTVRGDKVKK